MKATDFYMLILYHVTLLNFFIVCDSFFSVLSGVPTKQLSTKRDRVFVCLLLQNINVSIWSKA